MSNRGEEFDDAQFRNEISRWREVIEADSYYNSDQAVELGLVDRIVGTVQVRCQLPKKLEASAPDWLRARVKENINYRQPRREEDTREAAVAAIAASNRMSGYAIRPSEMFPPVDKKSYAE